MPLQGRCPLPSSSSSSKIIFAARARSYQNLNVSKMSSPRAGVSVTSIINLNFEFCSAWTTNSWRSQQHPSVPTKKPYRHGTGAPRHYPHTLIQSCFGEFFHSHIILSPLADFPLLSCQNNGCAPPSHHHQRSCPHHDGGLHFVPSEEKQTKGRQKQKKGCI
jgi:hypothetical protein